MMVLIVWLIFRRMYWVVTSCLARFCRYIKSVVIYIYIEGMRTKQRKKNSGFDFAFQTSKFRLLFKFQNHDLD